MTSQVFDYHGYQGSIEFSLADGVLHGKVLHINDLVTYEGKTLEELEQEFRAAVDDYLEFCAEEGVEPDKAYSGTFNVRVGPEIHRQLALAAMRSGATLNDTVKRILENWLQSCPEGFVVNHRHFHAVHVAAGSDDDAYVGEVRLQAASGTRRPTVHH